MAKYINFEADDDKEDEYVSDDNNVSDNFFDDNDYHEPLEELYTFENVTSNAQDAINEILSYNVDLQETNNYCHEDFNITSEKTESFVIHKQRLKNLKKLCILHIYYCHLMYFITQLFLQ